jgi:hypothetical protein
MKFTKSEIRAAILKAADTIERDGDLWNFGEVLVPDCGTPGCALGWIGFHLGIPVGDPVTRTARVLYGEDHKGNGFYDGRFYREIKKLGVGIAMCGASDVPGALRSFADANFPAEKSKAGLDSAYLSFRNRFVAEQESA